MLTIVAIGLWLTLHAARGTPVGDVLHRWLVAMPARRLAQIKRGQVLLWLVLIGVTMAAIWLLADDGRMLVAFGLPDIAALAAAIDLGTLLDVTLVAVAAASVVRVKAITGLLRGKSSPRRPRTRAIRARRVPPPSNDDEDRALIAA